MSNEFTEQEIEEMMNLSHQERLDQLRNIEQTIVSTTENLASVRKASRSLIKEMEKRRAALIQTSS